jgi:hypothetical protein
VRQFLGNVPKTLGFGNAPKKDLYPGRGAPEQDAQPTKGCEHGQIGKEQTAIKCGVRKCAENRRTPECLCEACNLNANLNAIRFMRFSDPRRCGASSM